MSEQTPETPPTPAPEPEAPQTDEPTPDESNVEPGGTDPEPAESPEPSPEPIEGDDQDVSPDAPETPAETPEGLPAEQPPEAKGLTEKEKKERDKKLDAERERHAKRLGEILAEESLHLVPCPICMHDDKDGWIFDPAHAPLAPEQITAVRALLGLEVWEEVPTARWAQTCETCNGYGRIKTGSHVEGRETTGCLDCGESGWINLRNRQLAQTNGDQHEEVVTGPTVAQPYEPDPRILSLQAEGYSVVPPIHFQAGS